MNNAVLAAIFDTYITLVNILKKSEAALMQPLTISLPPHIKRLHRLTTRSCHL